MAAFASVSCDMQGVDAVAEITTLAAPMVSGPDSSAFSAKAMVSVPLLTSHNA